MAGTEEGRKLVSRGRRRDGGRLSGDGGGTEVGQAGTEVGQVETHRKSVLTKPHPWFAEPVLWCPARPLRRRGIGGVISLN
jgi:hypothetical protein